MTAGRGIVHSEMPEQENGLLEGFQLWVNLPAANKMTEPAYQEFSEAEVPVEHWENGTEIRVITGKTQKGTEGPVKNTYIKPLFMDVSLKSGIAFEQIVDAEDNTLIYMIDGDLNIGNEAQILSEKNIGILERGEKIHVSSKIDAARFIVVSAKPLNEPIARGGPFVMNTEAEVQQAFFDYRNGRF